MTVDLRPVFSGEIREMNFNCSFMSQNGLVPGEITAVCRLNASAGLVSMDVSVSFTVVTECARCLETVSKDYELTFNHYLAVKGEDEDDEDDEYINVNPESFCPDELIDEDVNLFLPQRFLCRDDCKGLCPMCGQNLNEGECGCKRNVDPRLKALSDLLD